MNATQIKVNTKQYWHAAYSFYRKGANDALLGNPRTAVNLAAAEGTTLAQGRAVNRALRLIRRNGRNAENHREVAFNAYLDKFFATTEFQRDILMLRDGTTSAYYQALRDMFDRNRTIEQARRYLGLIAWGE